MGRPLNGVWDAVNRILVPLMPLESPDGLAPRLFPPRSPLAYDSGLWMGQEKNDPLWQLLAQLEKQVFIHMLSLLPEGEITGRKNISFGPKLCCLGEGVMRVKSCYSYPLQCVQTSNFLSFVLMGCGNVCSGHLDSHKGSHQCFQRLLARSQEGPGLIHRLLPCPQSGPRSVCLLAMYSWVGPSVSISIWC